MPFKPFIPGQSILNLPVASEPAARWVAPALAAPWLNPQAGIAAGLVESDAEFWQAWATPLLFYRDGGKTAVAFNSPAELAAAVVKVLDYGR